MNGEERREERREWVVMYGEERREGVGSDEWEERREGVGSDVWGGEGVGNVVAEEEG